MFNTPTSQHPIANSITWIADTLIGEVVITLCIIAVAFIGLSMLTGRTSIRHGAQVSLGCFLLLLGAPSIAASMMARVTPANNARPSPASVIVYEAEPRPPLPETTIPYTRASLRRRAAE